VGGGKSPMGWKHSVRIRGTSRHLTSMAMEAYENRWGFPVCMLWFTIRQLFTF